MKLQPWHAHSVDFWNTFWARCICLLLHITRKYAYARADAYSTTDAYQAIPPTQCKWWALLLLWRVTCNATEKSLVGLNSHYFSSYHFPSPWKHHNTEWLDVFLSVYLQIYVYLTLQPQLTFLGALTMQELHVARTTVSGNKEVFAHNHRKYNFNKQYSLQFNNYLC